MIGLAHYLAVAAILFTIGVLGIFVNRKNVIVILMSVELILLAVNINLVAFSAYLGDLVGQVFALFVLTVAAAEAALGWTLDYVRERQAFGRPLTAKDYLRFPFATGRIDMACPRRSRMPCGRWKTFRSRT